MTQSLVTLILKAMVVDLIKKKMKVAVTKQLQVHVVVWLFRYICMALMVWPGYTIYG